MKDVALTAETRSHEQARDRGETPVDTLGRYVVLGVLGSGGMGVVFSGYDEQLRRRVALKRIHRGGADARGRQRLLREAQALARLAHPNIVSVYEAFEVNDQLCIAMEFVAGKTLREWLIDAKPGQPEVLAALIQAGRGICAAHAAGLVHRDLKPDNIMLGDDGRVRVMDFGVARAVHDPPEEGLKFTSTGVSSPAALIDRITRTGAIVGTPGYAAPEQDFGLAADVRSDIFSFCVLAFEALHGVRPFVGESDAEILAAMLAGRLINVPSSRVPAWLDAAITRGLAVEPDARWPSMDALLAALSNNPRARARRRRLLAWFALAAVGVAATIVGVLWLRETLGRRAREAAAMHRFQAIEATIARAEAEGDSAGAEAAFRVFITDPAHWSTRALTRAWLGRGDRRTADPAAARAAYAEAYVSAGVEDDEREALQRLAGSFSRTLDGVGLGRSVDLLRDRGADDLAITDLAFQAALWRGDLPSATSEIARRGHLLADWAPTLQHLAQATRSPVAVQQLVPLPGDGPVRLAAVSGADVVLLDLDLREVGRSRYDGRVSLVQGTPWVLAQSAGEAQVVDLATGFVLARGAGHHIHIVAPFDATSDGVPELFFGRSWPRYGFERWSVVGGDRSQRDAHAGTDAGSSALEAHVVGDLDGDGRDELALGFGPWHRFELRVFRPDARGELELLATRQLGRIGGLALVRRGERPQLAVLVDNSCPSPDIFPDPPHTGSPPGLYLFEWRDSDLVEVDFVAFPRADDFGRIAAIDHEAVGDLDGDGREDLAFPIARGGALWLLLLRQTDRSFEPLLVAGLRLLAGAQLDDDAPLELLAALAPAGRLVALGLGDTPTPVPLGMTAAEPLPAPPPLRVDPWLVERWNRASDLTALALFDSAAESLRDTALMTADRPARSALLDRAGELFAGQNRLASVIALDHEVLGDPQIGARARLRRADALARLGRHEEALAEARRLDGVLALDPASARVAATLADDLSALLALDTRVDLRFDVPLAPAWQIHTPGALRRSPTRALLEFAIPAVGVPVAELPLDWSGGPISLEFELDIERLEFGASVELSLADSEGKRWLGAAISGQGGGGRLEHILWVKVGGADWVQFAVHEVESGHHRRRLAAHLTYFPGSAVGYVRLESDGADQFHRAPVVMPPAPGRHRLLISGLSESTVASLATGELRRLVVRGARLAASSASADPARLLAENQPRAALAALDEPGPRHPHADMTRLLALAGIGRLIDLSAAARVALTHAEDPAHLATLVLALRRHPLAAAALRDAGGPALLPILLSVWAFARPHRYDTLLRDELLEDMQELEQFVPRTDVERTALRELLETRASLWEHGGQPERAHQDRGHAAALTGSTSSPNDRGTSP